MKYLLALFGVLAVMQVANASTCRPGEIERRIYDLENSAQDADNDIRVVQDLVQRYRLEYCDLGWGMVEVLSATGSGGTAAAQNIIRSLADISYNTRESAEFLGREAGQIIRGENTADDAANTIRVVQELVSVERLEGDDSLRAASTLTLGFGSAATAAVQNVLRSLARMEYANGYFQYLAERAVELNRYENAADDTANTIAVVVQETQSRRINEGDALDAAIEVTRQLGSSETANIQNSFRSLASMASSDGIEIESLLNDFSEIAELENSGNDVAGNLDVVEGTVLRREISAVRGMSLFADELRYYGANRTADARNSYLNLVRRPTPPPPRPPRPIPPRPRPVPPRPVPRPRPIPRPRPPAPQPRPVPRPVPAPQPRPVPRPNPPAPQPRPVPRPNPQPAPQPRPAPRPRPHG